MDPSVLIGVVLSWAWLACMPASALQSESEFFEAQVRPLLVDRCFQCHGPESPGRGGLRMMSSQALLAGRHRGPVVIPGEVESSLLIRAIRPADDVLQMPPDGPLTRAEIELLETWIQAGAYWPPPDPEGPQSEALSKPAAGWAFQPVKEVVIPATQDRQWPWTPIDRFLMARWEELGLVPAADADPRSWLRRVTYDLTGLPPTPAATDAFLADKTKQAEARVVDRLLSSPHYGERWGRHWLDLARYADTAGNSPDYPIVDAYRYRNYVIDAFRQDKPYDQFLREQIAGDLLAQRGPREAYEERQVATGFLALARRFGVKARSRPHLIIEETLSTLGRSVLGLTLRCARCHDHKEDPITMEDYYGLYGFFSSTSYPFPGSENQKRPEGLVPLVPEEERLAQRKAYNQELARLRKRKGRADRALRDAQQNLVELQATAVKQQEEAELWAGFKAVRLGARDAVQSTLQVTQDGLVHGPGWAEYLVDWPADAAATVELAGFAVRGVGVRLVANGEVVADQAFLPSRPLATLVPRWIPQGPLELRAGENRLRLEVPEGGPRLWAMRLLRPTLDKTERDRQRQAAHKRRRTRKQLEGDLPGLQKQREQLAAQLEKLQGEPPAWPVAFAVKDKRGADAAVQIGGDPGQPGPVVQRRFPEVFGEPPPTIVQGSGRLQLAAWLTRDDHPLTARVIANRLWHHHFGRGLVATPSNFGNRGAPALDQGLLDYLAKELVTTGWSLKALHRQILLSHVYRISTKSDPLTSERDPENLWYARFRQRRLEAEALRDSLLAVAGRLDRTPGEGHPFPPVEKWNWTQHRPFQAQYPTRKRSVYLMTPRLYREPWFELFDGADPTVSTEVRFETVRPQQALFLMNSDFVWEQAQHFSKRLLKATSAEDERIQKAYRTLLGRDAAEQECSSAREFLAKCRKRLREEGVAAKDVDKLSWSSLARTFFSSNEFLYLD